MKIALKILFLLVMCSFYINALENSPNYRIVDTGVTVFYDNTSVITMPKQGDKFFGQDAQYQINIPSYTDNGDGTITDNVTGLMWEQDMGSKIAFEAAFTKAEASTLGGYDDWRVPSIISSS